MNDKKCFCIDREKELKERITELEKVVEAAEFLAKVKRHKDTKGKDNDWYVANQPIAWVDLFEALAELGEIE